MSFFRGFKYAFCGIIHCLKNERNMRFHTVAALYVLVFARFFAFSASDYLSLMLTIGGVIAAEMINTAIEELCDRVSTEYDEKIRHAKDAAAGAVLVLAVFAVINGIILFGNIDGWIGLYNFYVAHPLNFAAIIASAVLSLLFVEFGIPVPWKQRKKKKKGKEKEK